ncbi:MAG: alginate lyase family protein [Gemmatimonadaceae bacterium]
MRRAFARLRRVSLAELRERAAQALAVRAERAGWRDRGEPSDAELRVWLGGRFADGAAWRAHLATRSGPRFFASFNEREETVRALRRADPRYVLRVVERADAALGGSLDLLGYSGLACGSPIDWQRDPVSGVRASARHWSRIAFLDPRVAGDHKVIWELNRQQWLVDLAAAWWLTGDDRYAEGMRDALVQWMDGNPPKLGINWASSLELALRCISWIWAIEFLRRSALLDAATLTRLTKYIVLHGRHIERYLSTYFSPNTHLTGEALGLFYLGTYFPELRQARVWRERGLAVLLEQLPRHALADGVYVERSVHYQRYTVDFYTHLWLLDAANGGDVGPRLAQRLEAMLEHLQCLTRGDGTVSLTGDEDGGRLLFLDAHAIDDVRGTLATGALLFERPDFAAVAAAPSAELVWLLGPAAAERFASLAERGVPPRYGTRAFADGGVYVMRDGWSERSNHLVVDAGQHRFMNGGHAHADALSFVLDVGGRATFVDPGTYTYTVSARERDEFRSSAVHNAATVDGLGSGEPDGPFHWRRAATSRVLVWAPGADVDVFEGAHDGFEGLPSPVRYTRAIVFVHRVSLTFRDTFECTAPHDVALTFQGAADVRLTRNGAGVTVMRGAAIVCGLQVVHAGSAGDGGAFVLDEAWISPRYGARLRAPRCRYLAHIGPGTTVLTTAITLGAHRRSALPDAGRSSALSQVR